MKLTKKNAISRKENKYWLSGRDESLFLASILVNMKNNNQQINEVVKQKILRFLKLFIWGFSRCYH